MAKQILVAGPSSPSATCQRTQEQGSIASDKVVAEQLRRQLQVGDPVITDLAKAALVQGDASQKAGQGLPPKQVGRARLKLGNIATVLDMCAHIVEDPKVQPSL